jgi:hypothetical protein
LRAAHADHGFQTVEVNLTPHAIVDVPPLRAR